MVATRICTLLVLSATADEQTSLLQNKAAAKKGGKLTDSADAEEGAGVLQARKTVTDAEDSVEDGLLGSEAALVQGTFKPHYIGCYMDDGSRDLDHYQGNGYTIQSCGTRCASKNMRFFGMQYFGECWCGDSFRTHSYYEKVADSECGSPCQGETAAVNPKYCGMGWRNAVYDTMQESVPRFKGCYRDDGHRDLDHYQNNQHTIATCNAKCANYRYFGMQYYGECWCGNKYGDSDVYVKLDDKECGNPCPGETSAAKPKMCGKGWTNTVYDRKQPFKKHLLPGHYSVWYRGGKRNTPAEIGCELDLEQPGIFKDQLHTSKVRAKCKEDRDILAQAYILNSHGNGKYECVWREGDSLVGHHYLANNHYWGRVEYRLETRTTCKAMDTGAAAGEYSVWYRGGKRNIGATVSCDGEITQPGIFADELHTEDVREKCDEPRDAQATAYVLGTHGKNKYECLRREGDNLVGSHYTGPGQYWGTIEYKLEKRDDCKEPVVEPIPEPVPECQEGDMKTTEPALEGGCQRCTCAGGEWVCSCSMRHRKEIHDLSDEEFKKFSDALNSLKKKGIWDEIVEAHEEANMGDHKNGVHSSHNSPIFLPWHRKYFIEVENRLQVEADSCDVTIPYWNWALDVADFAGSEVFSSTRMGSMNADVKSDGEHVEDYCVTDGAFGSETAGSAFGAGKNKLGIYSKDTSDCIVRIGRRGATTNYEGIKLAIQNDYKDTKSFDQMRDWLERMLHNTVHVEIGGWKQYKGEWRIGHMLSMASPYDPMFFLHHGFVDFIWSQWQDTHVDESERLHQDHHKMKHLAFGNRNKEVIFSVSDVAMNMDINDDDTDTGDVVEKACVVYHERHVHNQHACGDKFDAIQACLEDVVRRDELHKVRRVQETDGSVTDVCSPTDESKADMDRRWFEMLVAGNMMSKKDMNKAVAWTKKKGKSLSKAMPVLKTKDADSCDKALCFSHADLLGLCQGY